MLTRTEAIAFLQNEWKIKDVEQQLQNDCETFLNKLIVTAHEMIPFQLLFINKLARMLPEERKAPSMEEIDHMCMSGMGGNCMVINMFISRLLKALGYSAFVCETVVTSHVYNPHLIVIIKDLVNTGDLHLVDCGLGLPSFRAISLNFNKESPVYKDSFLEYKFIKLDGKILRMHGDGDTTIRNNPPIEGLDFICGKWRRFYEFTIETIECEEFDFATPLTFLSKLQPRAATFPAGKAILLNNGNILSIEQKDKTLKRIVLQSKEEAFQIFKKYFPGISEDLVKQAYSTWQLSKL